MNFTLLVNQDVVLFQPTLLLKVASWFAWVRWRLSFDMVLHYIHVSKSGRHGLDRWTITWIRLGGSAQKSCGQKLNVRV